MVIIRLSRSGAKKRPFYTILVADSRKPRDGRYIERVGYFNPGAKGNEIELYMQKERIDYWKSNGAQLSKRVTSLLKYYRSAPTADAQKAARERKREAAAKRRKAAKANQPPESSEIKVKSDDNDSKTV